MGSHIPTTIIITAAIIIIIIETCRHRLFALVVQCLVSSAVSLRLERVECGGEQSAESSPRAYICHKLSAFSLLFGNKLKIIFGRGNCGSGNSGDDGNGGGNSGVGGGYTTNRPSL